MSAAKENYFQQDFRERVAIVFHPFYNDNMKTQKVWDWGIILNLALTEEARLVNVSLCSE